MKNSYSQGRSILIIFTLLCVFSLKAQVKVSGTVLDLETKEAVEFSNISLIKPDSSFVSGVSSGEHGQFALSQIAPGDYILSVSLIGYRKTYLPVKAIDKETKLGNIMLTPDGVALKEVTVTAYSVIQKPDRKLILPSANLIKSSNNGITLLQNLQLSRIVVNPINNSVTVPGGGAVQLRINGMEVTVAEITTLPPADIIRIEYHEDPGMRYGGAAAVLDYIVRRRETGGNISANLGNIFFQKLKWGENTFSAKINNRKSEFSTNVYWSTRKINWIRENEEIFVFPDQVLTRKEVGQPTQFQQDRVNYSLNYNLTEPEKYMLNLRLRNNYDDSPKNFTDRNSILYSSDSDTPLSISDHTSSQSNAPALDVYFQKNLNKSQLLILNLVGTYIDSRNSRTYRELRGTSLSTDIFSHVEGQKYSLIAEGIYEKTFQKGKLTAGLKHNQSFTSNQYSGNVNADVNLHFAETYIYTEYLLRMNKLDYTLGIGMTRTSNSQEGISNESYILRPALRINYKISEKASLRYSTSVFSTPPSLSYLNNVEQDIDSLQIRRGNPDLRTVWFLSNKITANYSQGIINLEFFAHYLYYNKPMMEQISYNGDKFVRMTINQKAMHQLYTEASISIKPWKDYITLKWTPGFNRFISEGSDYTHTFSYWRNELELFCGYKGFLLGANIYSRWNNLWGEDVEYGEKMHIITVGYNKPKWSLTAMIFNPFSKRYDQSSKNLSALAPNSSYLYTDNLAHSFAIRFSMNLDFGRKFKAGSKRLNNDDSDSGIMSGTKK